jgi:hypothetical protein
MRRVSIPPHREENGLLPLDYDRGGENVSGTHVNHENMKRTQSGFEYCRKKKGIRAGNLFFYYSKVILLYIFELTGRGDADKSHYVVRLEKEIGWNCENHCPTHIGQPRC